MKVLVFPSVVIVIVIQILGTNSLIIPDELPSLLSVIYSNIPTFKKGTDSRIGWGFRLGERADFQVMLELGPQTNTQPLANQGDGNNNKRNTLDNLANTLYAQRQQDKLRVKQKEERTKIEEQNTNETGGEWLQEWSKNANKKQEIKKTIQAKPGLGVGEIDAKSVLPDDSELLAKELGVKRLEYPKLTITKSVKPKAASTTEALDDVSLD